MSKKNTEFIEEEMKKSFRKQTEAKLWSKKQN